MLSIKRIVVILFFGIVIFVFNGCRISYEHKWDTSEQLMNVPDTLLNEDAVIIYTEKKIKNALVTKSSSYVISDQINLRENSDLFSFYNVIVFYSRIKMLNENGIQQYSFFEIPMEASTRIIELDARTIKKDGKIFDLKTSDIKEIRATSDYSRANYSTFRFSIPGVEVGDEIEIYYKIRNNGLYPYYEHYFHTTVPICKSKFVYEEPKGLGTLISSFNRLPDPITYNSMKTSQYVWEVRNIPSIEDQYNAIFSKELPYLKLMLRSRSFDWYDLNEYINTYLKDTIYSKNVQSDQIDTVLNTIIGVYKDSGNYKKFIHVCEYIQDSVKIINNEEDKNLRVWEYLKKKTINSSALYKLYNKLLIKYEIPFYLCYAKDRKLGELDLNTANNRSYTDLFFAFYDNLEPDKLHFIYPSSEKYKYFFDELPVSIRGTTGIKIAKKNELSKINIPIGNFEENYKIRHCKVQLSLDSNKISYQYRVSASGSISTILRAFETSMDNKKDINEVIKKNIQQENPNTNVNNIRIEEANKFYPHNYKYFLDCSENDLINKIDSCTFSIKIKSWLNHFLLPYQSTKRFLDYYTDFPFKDSYVYYINCEKNIDIINKANLNVFVENETGIFKFQLIQISPKMYAMHSDYIIKASVIAKENYFQINEINSAVEKIKNSSIIIKTVNS